jgi:surface antigen
MRKIAHMNPRIILGVLAFAFSASVLADPPPWAPAHGWRKKHDPNYVGYTGKKWERDYGILDGRCNAKAVGTVLGGAVGGAVGASVGRGDNRPVAILVGTVLGAVIGHEIGARVEESDRGCFGHALELAGESKPVMWTNPNTGFQYRLVPTRNLTSGGQPCREFVTEVSSKEKSKGKGKNKKNQKHKAIACRSGTGEWQLRS